MRLMRLSHPRLNSNCLKTTKTAVFEQKTTQKGAKEGFHMSVLSVLSVTRSHEEILENTYF
jgi:hypothetical protein